MFQIVKKLLIVISLASVTMMVVQASDKPNTYSTQNLEPTTIIDDLKFDSSRFSQPEDNRTVDLEDYIEISNNDEEMLENDLFKLYLNEDTLGMKILNKSTDYIWSSALENIEAGTYTELLSSGIGFEYINLTQNYNTRENIGLTNTQFSYEMTQDNNTLNFDIAVGGFCATRNCSRFYDRYLDGFFTLEEMIEFGYTELDISFSFSVTLTNQGLEVHIPLDSIQEGKPEEIQLSSIIVFPGLGATFMDDVPGYMMIPDGAGALIRYDDKEGRYKTPYQSSFYGLDYGLDAFGSALNNYRLSLPIFGAVHGVNQNGFLGIIESGASSARLYAFPNGAANLPYNLIFTKFDFKQTYRQSFSSDGSAAAWRIYESSKEDVHIRFDFLQGEDANYVGLANNYQNYLVNQNVLNELTDFNDLIPIHLQYLMADSKSRFIGNELVQMTSVDDVRNMYNFFMDQGLTNQRVSLLGWNDGGYSGHLPSNVDFENKLGSQRAFEALIDLIETDNELLLINNYVFGSDNSYGMSYRRDVAEGVDRSKLELECEICVYRNTYLLYPDFSQASALDDLQDYQNLGVDVLFQSLGSTLFSYYDRGLFNREQALEVYMNIIEEYVGYAQYTQPNDYALKGTSAYYDVPLFNNQYNYFDDLVPVLQIVMSGHLEMYSELLNFNGLGRTQLLRLIDYNVYPSYILTEERPSRLSGTDIEYYYSSEFSAWNETIVEEYEFINNALSIVQGEQIVSRTVPDYGVVVIEYSNQVSIVINYTQYIYNHDGVDIQPLDYIVKGGQ